MLYEKEKLKLLKKILNYGYRQKNEHLFFCPLCPIPHHKAKLSVNLVKNKFHCWICNAGGESVYYLIKRFGTFSLQQEWLSYTKEKDISDFNIFSGKNQRTESIKTEVQIPEEYTSLSFVDYSHKDFLEIIKCRNYLIEKRKLSELDIIKWRIGICLDGYYKNRIILPSYDSTGRLNYFVSRGYDTRTFPTYLLPDIDRDIIFNEFDIDWKKDVVLTEGVFDAIVIEQNGVPLLGSSIRENSRLFNKLVLSDGDIYLALDEDAYKKQIKIIKMFLEYGKDVYYINTFGYKDVGKMTKQEFKKRKEKALKITFRNYNKLSFGVLF